LATILAVDIAKYLLILIEAKLGRARKPHTCRGDMICKLE
jgi:hypothetical protein